MTGQKTCLFPSCSKYNGLRSCLWSPVPCGPILALGGAVSARSSTCSVSSLSTPLPDYQLAAYYRYSVQPFRSSSSSLPFCLHTNKTSPRRLTRPLFSFQPGSAGDLDRNSSHLPTYPCALSLLEASGQYVRALSSSVTHHTLHASPTLFLLPRQPHITRPGPSRLRYHLNKQ